MEEVAGRVAVPVRLWHRVGAMQVPVVGVEPAVENMRAEQHDARDDEQSAGDNQLAGGQARGLEKREISDAHA